MVDAAQSGVPVPGVMSSIRAMATRVMLWSGNGSVKNRNRTGTKFVHDQGRVRPFLSHNDAEMNESANSAGSRRRCVASPLRSGLSQWMQGPSGVNLLRAEVERVHTAVGNLFGYHCLQVGDLGGANLLSTSRILGRTLVDIDGGAPRSLYPLVSGAATSLPIDSHAVDVVILPHVLEFELHPHEALREASRVLVPEGSLVILSFNPLSPIGLRRAFKYRAEVAPWCGTYFGARRLRDWLTLLGFDLVDQRPCFAPGYAVLPRRTERRAFVEWMPPAIASARLILAKKRVNATLLVRSRWKPTRRRLAGVGLAGPSVRAAGGE